MGGTRLERIPQNEERGKNENTFFGKNETTFSGTERSRNEKDILQGTWFYQYFERKERTFQF